MRVIKLDNNKHAEKDSIQKEYAQRKESLSYKDKCNNSFMTSEELKRKLLKRAEELNISKNDLMTIYCEKGLGLHEKTRKSESSLNLNLKLIELSIKVMQATKSDPNEIKEAINLHSILKMELI